MVATKLNFSMVDQDQTDVYFGELNFSDKIPVWRFDGSITFVTYGRLLELFGGQGTTNTDTTLTGGQVAQNDATTVLTGGLIGGPRPVNKMLGRPL